MKLKNGFVLTMALEISSFSKNLLLLTLLKSNERAYWESILLPLGARWQQGKFGEGWIVAKSKEKEVKELIDKNDDQNKIDIFLKKIKDEKEKTKLEKKGKKKEDSKDDNKKKEDSKDDNKKKEDSKDDNKKNKDDNRKDKNNRKNKDDIKDEDNKEDNKEDNEYDEDNEEDHGSDCECDFCTEESSDDELIQKVLCKRFKSQSSGKMIKENTVEDSDDEDVISLSRRLRYILSSIEAIQQKLSQ